MRTSQQYSIMITGITKQMAQADKVTILIIVTSMLLGCLNSKCTSSNNEKLLQEYMTPNEVFTMSLTEQGAFGSKVTLKACSLKSKKLIEEIDLRGEDYLPKIDSVIGNNVYVHYNFPRDVKDSQIEMLNFESVVLGDALINKKDLKYNYIFKNVPAPALQDL